MDQLDIKCIAPGEQSNGGVAVFEEIVAPGGGPPRHVHREQLEVFHVLEGTIKFEVAGESFERGPGSAAVIPAGVVHAFKNVGDGAAKIHFELIPALSSEEAFERLTTGPIEDVEAFFDEYGMDLAGPPLD